MFFQQSHNARNAADEVDNETEMGSYYLETPPWAHPGKKRFSTVSGMSSRSRRTTVGSSGGTDQMSHSRSGSLESTPPIRDANNIVPFGPAMFLRPARSSTAQSRTSFSKPTGNPVWRFVKRVMSSCFGLFLFIQSYLCIGAFCFMWLERDREEQQWETMETLRRELSDDLRTCLGNETCHIGLLKGWEQQLVRFPPIYLEIQDGHVWSWIYSYYCSFTIISTIGYGNVTPLSPAGRIFAIVYAVIGIPLMLLFITDIGNKFARWTKIAVIAFRKWKYIVCQRCKRKKKKEEDTDSKDEDFRREDDEVEVKNNETSAGNGGTQSCDVVNTRFSIPEVHINIAMSTLDEESCEADTTRGDHEDTRGFNDYAKDGTGNLYIDQANSEYGGSSTGVEGYCSEAHQETNPHGSDKDSHLAPYPQTTEVELGGTGDQNASHDMEITNAEQHTVVDSYDSVSATDDDVFVYMNILPEKDRTPEDDTAMNSMQGTEFPAADNASNPAVDCEEITVVVDGSLEGENPGRTVDSNATVVASNDSDVQQTVVDLMKCEKCGQYLQSGHVDNGRPTVNGSSRRKRRKGIVDKTPKATKQDLETTHAILSRSKSKSLENISSTRNSTGSDSNRQSALKRGTDRRTSAPGVVSFRSQPVRQNGRLPYRIQERTRSDSSDLDHDPVRNTDYDGEYRDRAATDSGVASSSSNSTECSPKRQPYSVSVDVAGETMDSEDSNDDDVSNGDVMDSDEENKMSRLRQRNGVMDRRATIGKFSRISEADIAMLSIPIWLALLLLLIYLIFGAGCFAAMQKWSFLDGFYYCFISLSTIGFGDLVFLPQNLHAGLIFSFLYSFFGLCFTSMCMSLSSLELTLLSRKISAKFGVYSQRVRLRSVRWASRRRRTIRGPSPDHR